MDDYYRDSFLYEVNESFESLAKAIVVLTENPEDTGIINLIFRIVHTIKGSAATMEYHNLAKLCHLTEEIFDHYRNVKEMFFFPRESIELLNAVLDSFFKMTEAIAHAKSGEPAECAELLALIENDLVLEISKLKKNKVPNPHPEPPQSLPTPPIDPVIEESFAPRINIDLELTSDCPMPGVRSLMILKAIQDEVHVFQTIPSEEQFLSEEEESLKGFMLSIEKTEDLDKILEKLKQMLDVASVKIRTEEIKQSQKTYAEDLSIEQQALNQLSLEQKNKIKTGELKLFAAQLILADDVQHPAEQLYNLISNLNYYLGSTLSSQPTLETLGARAEKEVTLQTISQLLESALSSSHQEEVERLSLTLVILTGDDRNTVQDFLRDGCELKQLNIRDLSELVLGLELGETPTQANPNKPQELLTKPTQNNPSDSEAQGQAAAGEDQKSIFVRVNVGILDDLMNSVGELVINHNRLSLSLGDFMNSNHKSTLGYLRNVTGKIQGLVMNARMVPIKQMFTRFPRYIKNIARDLSKEVDLVIEGGETEIDRLITEDLNEILLHIARNAIDHGLESCEERLSLGKSAVGTLVLSAQPQGNNIVLTISDDGRGLNLEKIYNKGIERGLIDPEKTSLSDVDQIKALIFEPGLSTVSVVNDLSGRGVGMDVVRDKVNHLGGQISIQSSTNIGTSFQIIVPSSISIIQSLMLSIEDELYAIPLADTTEIVRVHSSDFIKLRNCPTIILHEEVIPLIDLGDFLSDRESHSVSGFGEKIVVIALVEGKKYGLIAGKLLGQQEIVIKPLPKIANASGYVNGATIFGDGRVAMILNVARIVKTYLNNPKNQEERWETRDIDLSCLYGKSV